MLAAWRLEVLASPPGATCARIKTEVGKWCEHARPELAVTPMG
jgi:hypothetical protein